MRSRFVSIVGMFILFTTGCLYNGGNPYGYYGPGPSVMPQQPWTGYPAGTYPSYNPYPTPAGSPYTPSNQPGGIQPTPVDPGGQPTYKGGDNSAPPFTPKVPDPSDPVDDTRPSGSNTPSLSPTSSTSRTSKTNDDLSTPFSEEPTTRLPRDFAKESVAEAEPVFESPVRQASHESDAEIPYGHSEKFDWLQGYVEFDDRTQTWVIIYTDNPQPSDKLGGEATLADHPALQKLRDADVVRVTGSIDRSSLDSEGKPKFRIKQLSKIQSR